MPPFITATRPRAHRAGLAALCALAGLAGAAGATAATAGAAPSVGTLAAGCGYSVSGDGRSITTWCPNRFPDTRYQFSITTCGTSSCQVRVSPTYRLGSTNTWTPGGYISSAPVFRTF